MTQMRDFLLKVKGVVVEKYETLDTPKKAADWLLKNKEELATWAFTQDKLDHIIKHKPGMITFGVEPGVGPSVVRHLSELRDNVPKLKDMVSVKDLGKNANGPWGDQMLKANNYKIAEEVARAFNSMDPKNFPKTIGEASKYFAMTGLNPDATMKYLSYSGLYRSGKLMPHLNLDNNVSEAANRDGKILWETANGLIQKGAGLGNKGIYNANPSGLWKPSQQYGQFKELFEAAGYNQKEMGPFASNARWYKYSGQQLGDKVMTAVREGKPKLVYIGGQESKMVKERINKEFNEKGTFTLKAPMKTGGFAEKKFEYFLYKQPDGTNTVAIFGPHTGALGFKSNRALMEATGEIAKGLIENGKIPDSITKAEVR